MVCYLVEIYCTNVDATDIAVVHCAVVKHPVVGIAGNGKLCGTWQIYQSFAGRFLSSSRNVKIIEYMECLENTLLCSRLLRCSCLEESSPHKP